MKKLLFSTIILIIILSCNKTASATADDEIVATWRGGEITLKEFEDFALYYAFYEDSNLAANSTFDERREILGDMVQFELVKLIADSLKLDTMQVIQDSYRRRLAAVTYEHFLYPDSVRRKVFPDSEILTIYNKMKREGQNLQPFKIEKQKIINYLIENNKYNYNKVQKSFYNFLFKKYGVNIYIDNLTDFVSMFNELLKEDIQPNKGFDRFNRDTKIASYSGLEIRTENLLQYFSKIDKITYPLITASDIIDYIFSFYYKDLVGKATVDLGYSKNEDVLKIVRSAMILEYYEQLTLGIFTEKDKIEKWKNHILKYYNAKVHHQVFEKTFYFAPDIYK